MSESYRRNVVEAALLAAGKSMQLGDLAHLCPRHRGPTLGDGRLQDLLQEGDGHTSNSLQRRPPEQA